MKDKAAPNTDVILVVKGAGLQKEDDTLNNFLEGFLPAVTAIDQDAKVIPRYDLFANRKPTTNKKDSSLLVTEVTLTDHHQPRRIWVKEAYWEHEIIQVSPLKTLQKAWHMASYAYGNLLHEIVKNPLQKKRPFREYLVPFFLMYFSISAFLLWTYNPFDSFPALSISAILCVFLALPPALESYNYLKQYDKCKNSDDPKPLLRALPGLPSWVLALLIIAFFSHPVSYISGLIILGVIQTLLLLSRAWFWRYRDHPESDSPFITEYLNYQLYKNNNRLLNIGSKLILSPVLSRFTLLLALPVTFVTYGVAKILKWSGLFSGIGRALDHLLSLFLSGVMADVVSYAMNPAQGYRIRSVVANYINHFSECDDVRHLHIFAHSQGTPITYETLFRDLSKPQLKKVRTYITIGSVLSFYKQAREALDHIYVPRFSRRQAKEDKFDDEFKWFNFWNFSDPITEFYGLDEYIKFKNPYENDEKIRTNPINIKSRASIGKNHFEYWSNLEEIQRPFVKRILNHHSSNGIPDEWCREEPQSLLMPHKLAVLILCIVLLAIAYFTYGLVKSCLNACYDLKAWFQFDMNLFDDHFESLNELVKLVEPFFSPSLFNNVSILILGSKTLILAISLTLVVITAFFTWLNQFYNAIKAGREAG